MRVPGVGLDGGDELVVVVAPGHVPAVAPELAALASSLSLHRVPTLDTGRKRGARTA